MMSRRDMGSDNEPESIASILETLRITTDLGQKLDQAQIWEHWPRVAGPKLSEHSKPVGVKDGTLTVEVENSVWMHRLSYCKPDLLARINGFLKEGDLVDIFLSLAPDPSELEEEIDPEGS